MDFYAHMDNDTQFIILVVITAIFLLFLAIMIIGYVIQRGKNWVSHRIRQWLKKRGIPRSLYK